MLNPEDFPDSPQVKLIHEWGQGFEKKDINHIAKYLHKDYRHIHYPRSLGQPEQTKEQWVEHFTRILGLMTENKTTIHSIVDAPGKVIVHLTANINTAIGIGTARESIFIDHIVTDEDGSLKIGKVEEFTDSKSHLDFIQAIAAANANK